MLTRTRRAGTIAVERFFGHCKEKKMHQGRSMSPAYILSVFSRLFLIDWFILLTSIVWYIVFLCWPLQQCSSMINESHHCTDSVFITTSAHSILTQSCCQKYSWQIHYFLKIIKVYVCEQVLRFTSSVLSNGLEVESHRHCWFYMLTVWNIFNTSFIL